MADCCADMERLKSCGPRGWTEKQVVKRVTISCLNIGINCFSGMEVSMWNTKVCPHNHTLGSFPSFSVRCCCWKLTSLSTGIRSEFWLLRSAFNCWNLFFVFDFGGMITWMFEILKKAKSAKIHTYEVSNQAKWYFKLFRVYFDVKLKYCIRFLTM